jgi:hypothetical protein
MTIPNIDRHTSTSLSVTKLLRQIAKEPETIRRGDQVDIQKLFS